MCGTRGAGVCGKHGVTAAGTKHNPKHSLKQTLRLIRPNPELLGPRLTLMYVYDCVLYLPPSSRVSHRPRYPWHPWHPVFSTKPYCSKNEENGSASHVRFTFGTFPRRFRPEKKDARKSNLTLYGERELPTRDCQFSLHPYMLLNLILFLESYTHLPCRMIWNNRGIRIQ